MKRFILFILILLASVWLGLQIKADPGYVLVANRRWTAEMPLWFATVSLLVSFLVFYGLCRLITKTSALPSRLRSWSRRRRLRRAHYRTNRGLLELAEGNWSAAEKDLLRAINYSDTPLVNYLAAARAAQELGASDRRDDYLRKAHEVSPDADLAIGMAQAQLFINHKQYEQALAILKRLRELAPNHIYILKLLKKLLLELEDWSSLLELLPELRKQKVLAPNELQSFEIKIFQGLLKSESKIGDVKAVEQVWQQIPKDLRKTPALANVYITFKLEQQQTGEEEENLLREMLKKNWNAETVRLYGLIKADADKQLAHAENCLVNYKDDPILLLTLGRLCIRNQLWGKARSYLETSIAMNPSPEAYAELGSLLEQLGENSQVAECYRKGLLAVMKGENNSLQLIPQVTS